MPDKCWQHYSACNLNTGEGTGCTCLEVKEEIDAAAYDDEPSNMANLEDGTETTPTW